LRKENELLKLNLQVVLEKVRTQEDELRALKGKAGQAQGLAFSPEGGTLYITSADGTLRLWDATTGKQVEGDAVKAWRGVRDKDEMRPGPGGLEEGGEELREQLRNGA